MRDPGHAAGNQIYRPPPAECVCGHAAGFHLPRNGYLGSCSTYRQGAGHCDCHRYIPLYIPQLAPAGGAAEHRPPPAGASKNAPP